MPSKSPPTPPEWQLHLWENFVLMLLKLRQVFLNPKFLDISNTCCTFFQPHRLGWWFSSFPDMVCQKDITLLSMPGYFKTAYICFFENSEVEHIKYITPKLMKTNHKWTIHYISKVFSHPSKSLNPGLPVTCMVHKIKRPACRLLLQTTFVKEQVALVQLLLLL